MSRHASATPHCSPCRETSPPPRHGSRAALPGSSPFTCGLPVGAPGGLPLSALSDPSLGAVCASASWTGRPQVNGELLHAPVMVGEIVEALCDTPQGVIVDATVGDGGHAAALLEASSRHRLIGLDRDPEAVAVARRRLAAFGARAGVVHARFDRLGEVLAELAPGEPVSGALFDLGVSTRQLAAKGRGFSYRIDAPLDMRMDPSEALTAAEIVNEWPEAELASLFAEHGEVRFGRRVAKAVVAARPVTTTLGLVAAVSAGLPAGARRRSGHPATRVFQALRVTVNGELRLLPGALDQAMAALAAGGRVAVLSYHSGEDRIVKQSFTRAEAGWCSCPSRLPCVCGAVPALAVLNRGARLARGEEVEANPRASSARLRVAERLDAPWRATGAQSSWAPEERGERDGEEVE